MALLGVPGVAARRGDSDTREPLLVLLFVILGMHEYADCVANARIQLLLSTRERETPVELERAWVHDWDGDHDGEVRGAEKCVCVMSEVYGWWW